MKKSYLIPVSVLIAGVVSLVVMSKNDVQKSYNIILFTSSSSNGAAPYLQIHTTSYSVKQGMLCFKNNFNKETCIKCDQFIVAEE